MRQSRSLNGFTLIELLVVIAIIALLVTLITPSIRTALDSGASGACAANMRQIGAASMQWAADWNGRLPPFRIQDEDYATSALGSQAQSWTDYGILGKYLGNDRQQSSDGIVGKTSGLACPADREINPFPYSLAPYEMITSYGMNGHLLRELTPGDVANGVTLRTHGIPLSRVHAATTILAIDAHRNAWNAGYGDSPPCYASPEPLGGFSWSPGAPNSIDNWAPRHRDQQGANVVFVDGHVEAVVGDELRERVANRTYRLRAVN